MGIRGVNLGNWLVLEKWMGGSPLSAAAAADDHDLIDELDDTTRARLLVEHYRSYVTEETFAWMATAGVDVVRVPAPYHLFGTAHHVGCVDHLDHALAWAARHGMGILVDLHTVPLSQNAFDNGGYTGLCAWHRDPARVDFALDVLCRIARRYANSPALWGIQPLNEPASRTILAANLVASCRRHPRRVLRSRAIPRRVLKHFYERFYHLVRPVVGPGVKLVFHDQFDLGGWDGWWPGGEDDNVWLDTHCYVNFVDRGFRRYDLDEYRAKTEEFADAVGRAAQYHHVMVGEWCLGNHSPVVRELDEDERRRWYRSFADAQLDAWDRGEGGCFWSLRVEGAGRENWSFEHCARHGWIDLRHER